MKSDTSKLADVRGNRPSASRMTRIFHCPASFLLNAMEIPETSSAAEEGRMLHRVMELSIKDANDAERAELDALLKSLNDEQMAAYQTAVKLVSESVLREHNAYNGDTMEAFEKRFWAASKLFSGQGDAVFIRDNGEAVIVDYKFGRGEVERAERNYQLAAMAVLIADNFDSEKINKVRAMIIQPRALDKSRRITECEYAKADIDAAREAINAACKEAIEAENPAQKCGYWCKYCPSSYRCKAAQEAISAQYKLAVATPNLTIGAHNARQMFERAQLVKKYCDDVLAAVKNYIANNPDAQCGLVLAPGVKRAKLGDAGRIFEAVEGVGITPEEFVSACEVGVAKLQTLYHAKRKAANGKQTKKSSDLEVKELLESKGLLTYSQTAPTLKLLEGAQ